MPGLGITCGTLRREVGRYLGFDRDPANWNANEVQDVWDIIDSGLRQFYRPPRLDGDFLSHQWSFLRPIAYISLTAGVGDYLLPEDFGGLDGGIYYVEEDTVSDRIAIVNEGYLLRLRQAYWHTVTVYSPQYAAITVVQHDQVNQQRYKLMIWPNPDEAYSLRYKYFARQDGLRNDSSVPVGAADHAETIIAACLAAAESRLDDALAEKRAEFMRQLQASIDFDRRANSPQTLGYNGDCSDPSNTQQPGYTRAIGGLVTLEAYPP